MKVSDMGAEVLENGVSGVAGPWHEKVRCHYGGEENEVRSWS